MASGRGGNQGRSSADPEGSSGENRSTPNDTGLSPATSSTQELYGKGGETSEPSSGGDQGGTRRGTLQEASGKKQTESKGGDLKPPLKAAVGVAPFLSNEIESVSDVEQGLLKENKGEQLVAISTANADALGVEVVTNHSSASGWYSGDKNKTIN